VGLRLALSILTVLPVGRPRAETRDVSRAMTSAPAVGLVIGGIAAGVFALVDLAPRAQLLAAALGVASVALASRFLHLDGLADTADAFGSKGDQADALRIMRAPDVGAFALVAVALALIIDVAAVDAAGAEHRGVVCLVVAAAASRLTVTMSSRRGLSAAAGSRLGAWVAGTVTPAAVVTMVLVTSLAALGIGATWTDAPLRGASQCAIAVVAALAAGEVVRSRASRLVGGLTGDVIGAAVEVSFTAAAVAFAVTGGLLH
jgi:adenosylcobinamide-GDP ribazoletransferase